MTRSALCLVLFLAACASEPPADERATDMSVPSVMATVETESVKSSDDAADDPAFWIDGSDAASSRILGTDKQAGLYVYDLAGGIVQFLPSGNLNNVDVRQGVSVGAWSGDLAAATNRSDNTVTLFTLSDGLAAEAGRIPVIRDEPYGFCLGTPGGEVMLAVTHKGGEVDLYRLNALGEAADATHLQTIEMGGQLEGCVFDEPNGTLYVGEEEAGITRFDLEAGEAMPVAMGERIDEIGSGTGLAIDVEGLTIYRTDERSGYLLASSQGNNTYAVYDRESGEFLGRFRVADNAAAGIDGTEETDGIDVTSVAMPGFPQGVFVVQDGFNRPKGETQNFKYIDWRDIAERLELD